MSLGYEQITVSSTVLDVDDLTIPAETLWIELQAEAQPVRFTMDNTTDPSASSGMVLLVEDEPSEFMIEDVRRMKFVRGAGTDATLNVHYFGGAP